MAENAVHKNCFLCLNPNFITLIDDDLTSKIAKYLQIESKDGWIDVCTYCIESIENFHQFYERVQSIHCKDNKNSVFTAEEVYGDEENIVNPPSKKSSENGPESPLNVFSKADIPSENVFVDKSKCFKEVIADSEVIVASSNKNSIPNKSGNTLDVLDGDATLTAPNDQDFKNCSTLKHPTNEALQPNTTDFESSSAKRGPPKGSRKSKNCAKSNARKVRELEKQIISFFTDVQCPVCGDGVVHATLKVLEMHFKECHEEKPFFKCCDKSFKLEDKVVIKKHMMIHTIPDCCKCDICGKILSSPRLMRIHKELHIPESERNYACDVCGRKFGGNTELYRHMRDIHSPQETVCDICGKKFRKRITFKVHMKTEHGNNKKYVCEICAKTYKALSTLKQHTQSAHSSTYLPKTKECQFCGKRMTPPYLKKHILRVHNDATPYECSVCHKLFKLTEDLRNHMIAHSEERPFPCHLCKTAFKTKATLRSHMVKHTDTQSVQCPYCGKIISSITNYMAHRRRMHADEHNRLVTQMRAPKPETNIRIKQAGSDGVFCEEIVEENDFMLQ